MKLDFESGGERWSISCEEAKAPRTLACLASCLPLPLQLHTPKIAGNHIYWHAPFVTEVESGMDVVRTPPGAFIYWPVRQFLEITFAPLQAETATVTVLGQLDGPVDGIARLAARLREDQGRQIFTGKLSFAGAASSPAPSPKTLLIPNDLHAARLKLWAACPEDVKKLTQSRGIMHPAGPVLMAESEARILHENLWWIRERRAGGEVIALRYAAALALNRAATRLRDFCHLTSSSKILFDLETAIDSDPALFEPLLDEAILCSGRLAAWIDLQIPWNAINEKFRAVLAAHPAPAMAAVAT
ncbi:hypothetical protein [Taklimakanibacter deserti]|uniref:hypothetical protein n=1 Tax=Taklimakanibacter deserti TaxID=2267839 RepID=UPI000E6562E4